VRSPCGLDRPRDRRNEPRPVTCGGTKHRRRTSPGAKGSAIHNTPIDTIRAPDWTAFISFHHAMLRHRHQTSCLRPDLTLLTSRHSPLPPPAGRCSLSRPPISTDSFVSSQFSSPLLNAPLPRRDPHATLLRLHTRPIVSTHSWRASSSCTEPCRAHAQMCDSFNREYRVRLFLVDLPTARASTAVEASAALSLRSNCA
jgi:hypothetical protein